MSANVHPVRAEPDRIATPRLVVIAVVTLTIFFGASAVTGWGMEQLRRRVEPTGPSVPRDVGRPQIGMVEQHLFEQTRTGEEWKAAELRRLSSYGWVDRKAGIVHVPVEQGMERVLRGERP